MKMVWAVIRSTKVDTVAQRLKSIGLNGFTVSSVRGCGEEWHVYEPLIHGGHHKLEVILKDDQADTVVNEIVEHAYTGVEGDGIVSIFDLDAAIPIRLKQKMTATAAVQNNLES
ncbi:MAG: P-II family nitrogen regulator [Acidobacteriota bacterium]